MANKEQGTAGNDSASGSNQADGAAPQPASEQHIFKVTSQIVQELMAYVPEDRRRILTSAATFLGVANSGTPAPRAAAPAARAGGAAQGNGGNRSGGNNQSNRGGR